ncbi:hypothetical protein BU26DRAFT_525246 [Trematosphaeria pertusa]|uniref:Protein kinase domain-containing protein n=1 Tax=Trematosphaeria pertusa TaxID=390896 RepID=A0A6A6HTA8_9PLEO|nr:uncharacterized protein BU26DRAFT_525246 [Trematosphaeria pertusa]KAF2241424.1 hypothetical protein BU26DRAFT_525246 [Trematosphaeria pertusa]
MDDEVARLRQALAEVEVARLRQALAEEENRALDERRRLEEAENRALDERRRLEEAENRAPDERRQREEAQRQAEKRVQGETLMPYLEACHSLSLALQVVTDLTRTTKGDTTDPDRRIYPRRIVRWDDFPARQEEIWNQLPEASFASQHQFPTQHQLDYVRDIIRPVSSECGLRYFEHDTVELAVEKLIVAVNDNELLRDRLGLRGTVTFESHTNFGNNETNLSKSLQNMSLSEGGARDGTSARPAPKAQSIMKGMGKGNLADNCCIYETSNGVRAPKTAIEYKAPHKLPQDVICTGLKSEIQPKIDVIDKDVEAYDDFQFASKALAAAVVTQLFSYMIGKGIQYGYVCTGQVFVFLYIPDDPSMVYYYVSVPNSDVLDDDANRLHRTAVAQVFAFVIQSLRAKPPSQSWIDAAASLDTWTVGVDDVLSRIPETVRKGKEPRASPYKPSRWRGFQRSPIRTRSSCKRPDNMSNPEDDSDDEDAPPSPTTGRSTRSGKKPASSSSIPSGRQGQRGSGDRQQGGAGQTRIQDRPYCTHHCLLGLACGGPIDESCPNAGSHGSRHMDRAEFMPLVRTQLATDRGRDADAAPLYLSGSFGALFKIRLSAFGYTFVAKGVEGPGLKCLKHEERIYDHLRPIQGEYVPVCLGLINLVLPYYYDGGVFRHFLLLSWAGKPLHRCTDQIDKTRVIAAVATAFTSLHRLQVLHGDAELRNITYDEGPMIVDLERAKLCARGHLDSITPNSQSRKTKRDISQEHGQDPFGRELRSVVESVSRSFGVVTMPRGSVFSTG